MNENRIYGGLLLALLVLSYLSWHHEPDRPGGRRVPLSDIRPAELERVVLFAPTATVTVTFPTLDGSRRAWFEFETKTRTRRFAGNAAFDTALEGLARFEALRSLGRVEPELLQEMGLAAPKRRMALTGRTELVFELGERTPGARDFYARRPGEAEVFLIPGAPINDFETPAGRYMQRKLRVAPLADVASIELRAGEESRVLLHQNRLSATDSYWAFSDAPDTPSEALGNYVDKLEKLSVSEYLEPDDFESAALVLTVLWKDKGEQVLDRMELRRPGELKNSHYYARSAAVAAPVKVPVFFGEQLEKDLSVVFGTAP